MPSRDVAADVEWFCEMLGARLVFAIEAYGGRVAMVALGDDRPALLFADHLDGEAPVLVYRVADLEAAGAALREGGFDPGPELGIPHGPLYSFAAPGGQRVALYELTRPGAAEHLEGRRDF
jgi:catechol 2,3-dioxygenase-like lactoylglutathione lyase family enzyme